MARGVNRLSARTIATAKKPGIYSDGAGLCLQVTANVSGNVTKSWIYRFMLAGRPRKMGLGAVHTFTLAEARELARQARQKLAGGIDPIEHRLAQKEARRRDEAENITFRDAADRYLAAHESGWRSAKHRRQWGTALATHAYPALGGRPVKAIDNAIINSTLAEAVAPDAVNGWPRSPAHRDDLPMGQGRHAVAAAQHGENREAPPCLALAGDAGIHERTAPAGRHRGQGVGIRHLDGGADRRSALLGLG